MEPEGPPQRAEGSRPDDAPEEREQAGQPWSRPEGPAMEEAEPREARHELGLEPKLPEGPAEAGAWEPIEDLLNDVYTPVCR